MVSCVVRAVCANGPSEARLQPPSACCLSSSSAMIVLRSAFVRIPSIVAASQRAQVRSCRFCLAGSSQPSIIPELEHQQGPEGLAEVAGAGLMFGDEAGDGGGVEDPLSDEAIASEEIVHQRGQGPAEPT